MRLLIALLILCFGSAAEAAAAPADQAMVSPAANIASRLGTATNPIIGVLDFTPFNDPEQLMGLPGQYQSKAYFRDSNGMEGLVEVFTTPIDAIVRKANLDQTGMEYVIVRGPVVVRLLGATDAQQSAYRQSVARLLGSS